MILGLVIKIFIEVNFADRSLPLIVTIIYFIGVFTGILSDIDFSKKNKEKRFPK